MKKMFNDNNTCLYCVYCKEKIGIFQDYYLDQEFYRGEIIKKSYHIHCADMLGSEEGE